MNFETICEVFPKEEKYWPCLHPSSALPFFIKSYLRQHFGGIFAANDIYKRNFPNRLGTSTRPFEIGDPISTISKNHFVKTQELLTRIDYSTGRQRAVIIFHSYPNMTYQSELSNINKGQLSNGVVAILEEIHKCLGHSIQIMKFSNDNFFEEFTSIIKKIKNSEYIYFISDLLFDSSNTFASPDRVFEVINYFHIKKIIFIIVRDPMEYPNTETDIEELSPLINNKYIFKNTYFSGKDYYKNIHIQLEYFYKKVSESNNFAKVIYPRENVKNLINFIINDIFRKK